ncbi:MAG: Na/Pi symporter [Campylobacterota bacterium]|nr:Na/Pi symporter [Campylobacterota bacterium]
MFTTILEALTGLGIFLFGMTYMEVALKEFAGANFKKIVKNYTSTNFKAVLTGITATGILQSSSVVTLMALSFVSASLISLRASIGVIFGSNLGTTVTAWIVALVGFKLKLELFALPMVGLGALFYIFLDNQSKLASFAKIIIGFGLLFFGLDLIKTAVDGLASTIDIAEFNTYPLAFFLFLGLAITAVIQSSSATTAIILSALSVNIISFEFAAVMMIGANIGTTVTAMLGSIGGIPDKKRAAAAHFLFNVITAVIALLILPAVSYLLLVTLDFSSDLTMALALFHTIFNLLGVLSLYFFINKLADFLQGYFQCKEVHATKYIHLTDLSVAESAVVALRNEGKHLFLKCMKYTLLSCNIQANDLFKESTNIKEVLKNNSRLIEFDHKKNYQQIKSIEADIFSFVQKLNNLALSEEDSKGVDRIMNSVRESAYVAKLTKDMRNNSVQFVQSNNSDIHEIYEQMRLNMLKCFKLYIDFMRENINMLQLKEQFEEVLETNRNLLREIATTFNTNNIKSSALVSLNNTNRTLYIIYTELLDASPIMTLKLDIENGEAES